MEKKFSLKNLRYWWPLVFVSGIILILIGIWVLISPAEAYFSLSIILAVGMVFSGLFRLFFSLRFHRQISGWSWLLIGAIIDIGLGAYLLYFPMLTMILLPVVIGLWLLFRGFMAIGRSLEADDNPYQHWLLSLLPGLIVLICSFFILDNPLIGVLNIVSWIAIAFIISGLFRIFFSLRLFKSTRSRH